MTISGIILFRAMISKIINNFSNNFILNSKDYLLGQNLIEDFANNKYFESLLINLAEINPYDPKISNEFLKLDAISALPHLRVFKTYLNLTLPKKKKIKKIPIARPTSPFLFTKNALIAASFAVSFLYQKPISK